LARLRSRRCPKALNSGATFQVRMASATALGELGDERCVEPLVQALADTSLNVQRAAAHALSLLGNPAVDPLLVVARLAGRFGAALGQRSAWANWGAKSWPPNSSAASTKKPSKCKKR
jgi:hypothetical protein